MSKHKTIIFAAFVASTYHTIIFDISEYGNNPILVVFCVNFGKGFDSGKNTDSAVGNMKQVVCLDGMAVTLSVKKITRKNIIVRCVGANMLAVHVPPWLRQKDLERWIAQNRETLAQVLASGTSDAALQRPEYVWFRGAKLRLSESEMPFQTAFNVPMPSDVDWSEQKATWRRCLYAEAERLLLPQLQFHADRIGLVPRAVALSSAKTFWGVCRSSGIRLNWRLVGAPEWVADYVCVHELCHLRHRNHSREFWDCVRRHTSYTDAAKAWLKRYGAELFWAD